MGRGRGEQRAAWSGTYTIQEASVIPLLLRSRVKQKIMVCFVFLSATFRAMMEAIRKLATDGAECCSFHDVITETELMPVHEEPEHPEADAPEGDRSDDNLNASQRRARDITQTSQISLIWGPPGMAFDFSLKHRETYFVYK